MKREDVRQLAAQGRLVRRLAAIPASRWSAMTVSRLAVVADALQTRRGGRKDAVVAGIVARLDALDRAMALGDDALVLSRRFTAAGLQSVGAGLGVWMGANRYGLAAQVIGRRDRAAAPLGEASMPTDLGPVFYPDLRPRRPLYLSGVDHEVLRRLEAVGHDVGWPAQPASYGPGAVARYRTWGLDNGCFSAGDRFDVCELVRWLASFDDPGLRWGNRGSPTSRDWPARMRGRCRPAGASLPRSRCALRLGGHLGPVTAVVRSDPPARLSGRPGGPKRHRGRPSGVG